MSHYLPAKRPLFGWRGRETVTVTVPFMPGAPRTIAVMLCLPAVIKVTPLVKVWEPASLAVKR